MGDNLNEQLNKQINMEPVFTVPVQEEMQEQELMGIDGEQMMRQHAQQKAELDGAEDLIQKEEEKNKEEELAKEKEERIKSWATSAQEEFKATFRARRKEGKKQLHTRLAPQMETVMEEKVTVIKRTIKPDKVIREHVVKGREKKQGLKAVNMQKLKEKEEAAYNEKIEMRRNLSIDIKKKMDYRTVEQLSDFGPLIYGEELEKLTTLYGEGISEQKNKTTEGEKKAAETDKIFPAMDIMTGAIMRLQPTGYNLHSDDDIANSATELEKMTDALKSYKKMLAKHPGYLEKKMGEKGDDGASYGEAIIDQIEKLTAVSDYYRLRKLVIEDDAYAAMTNGELSLKTEKGDNAKIKRLKRNIRLSYKAGLKMQEIFSGNIVDKMEFDTKDKEADIVLSDLKLKEEGKLKEGKTKTQDYLERLSAKESEMDRIYQERYITGPDYLYNTLSFKKVVDLPASGKDALYVFSNDGNVNMESRDIYIERIGKNELREKIDKMGKDKTGKEWREAPVFKGGQDKLLEEFKYSDMFIRLDLALCTELAYKRSDEEMLEMIDILSIQSDEKKWAEIKKDPEKAAYYESAYKEMVMKMVYLTSTSTKRIGEAIGPMIMMLHPVDFAMQLNMEIRQALQVLGVVTNSLSTPQNIKMMEKLMKENNNGRYQFDLEEFQDYSAVTANSLFKVQGATELLSRLGDEPEESDSVISPAALEMICREFEEYRSDLNKRESELSEDQLEELQVLNRYYEDYKKNKVHGYDYKKKRMQWAAKKYYTTLNAEHMTAKDKDGNIPLREGMCASSQNYFSGNEERIYNAINNNKFEMPSEEELAAYEKSLKERKMPTLRAEERDPYAIQFIKNGLKELVEKDENTGQIKIKEIFGIYDAD